jgi:hypothetical protein
VPAFGSLSLDISPFDRAIERTDGKGEEESEYLIDGIAISSIRKSYSSKTDKKSLWRFYPWGHRQIAPP